MADLKETLDRISPPDRHYWHHLRNVDDNGHSHIQASLLGSSASVTVPIVEGDLHLGSLQEIMLIDLQTGKSPRQVMIQAMGEN